MKPVEKWKRLNNPKSIDDYGLSLSGSELKTFPEGREIVKAINDRRREISNLQDLAAKLGLAAARKIDEIISKVLSGG